MSAKEEVITNNAGAATRVRAFEARALGFLAKDDLLPLRTLIGNFQECAAAANL